MNLNELNNKVLSAGLHPVRIEGSTDKEDTNGLVLVGDFDDFIEAANTLKASVVFVTSRLLDESDFKYEPEYEEYEDEDEGQATIQNGPIYLPVVLPSLSRFKEFVNENCAFKLSILMSARSLDFFIEEPWWPEFIRMRDEAIEKVENDIEAARTAQEAARRIKERDLLDRLKKLIADSDFTRLPTQRAMLQYALDKIPELEAINKATLKDEMQMLDARIKAKGLNRRRQ